MSPKSGEHKAQENRGWVAPHCTTKVCYVCRFCQLASHIYASKQSGFASDGSSDCVLAVRLVVHLLFLGPFRPGIPLPSPQCVCGNRVGTKIPYKASASSKRRLPLSPAKVCRFLLEIVLLRIQSSTNAIYMKPKLDDTQGRSRTLKIIQEIDQTLKDTQRHSRTFLSVFECP